MRIQKNPVVGTYATIWKDGVPLPIDRATGLPVAVEEMTPTDFAAWVATQPAIEPEPPPVPTSLPAWRIRASLKNRGLLANVKTLIASLPKEQRDIAEEQFVDSRFERGHPLIEQLGAALKLTSKDLDDIFREADTLV